MTNRLVFAATVVSLTMVLGCGDDDGSARNASSEKDGGADASTDTSAGRGGSGGRAGSGGRGGSNSIGSGTAGAAGDEGAAGEKSDEKPDDGDDTTFAIGGEVTGLSGSGLVLQNEGGGDLTVDKAGKFTFDKESKSGEDYEVTVKTQPSKPSQTCKVSSGKGKVGKDAVTNVKVECTTNKYKLGGTITGLTAKGLVLKNGSDTFDAAGTKFEFTQLVESGADYAVTIATQPADQICSVESASGKVGSEDVTSVVVTCHGNVTLQVAPGLGNALASWSDAGASSYTLKLTTSATCDLETAGCPDFREAANVKSPYTVPDLTNGTPYYFQVTANYSGGAKSLSNKTATRPNKPRVNGLVYTVAAASNGASYAGGTFTRLSVHTGGAVPLHKTTGFPSELPNFPIPDGDVISVAADGSGGYYIGGPFTRIDGAAHSGLAHIKSDGTLDPAFNPSIDGIVRTIAVHNTTVYVAGTFTMVGGVASTGFAAIDASGATLATFNPAVVPTGSVSAITFVGNDVVAGGSFTTLGGQAQPSLALLDGTTGAPKAWNPAPDGVINALAANGDTVYAGGEFFMIGGQMRRGVAALNGTGATAGTATDWNPGPSNAVTQIAVAGNTVYISGPFDTVGAAQRSGVAAIDSAGAGAVKDWNPTVEPAKTVTALAASADTVYLGGAFTKVGGMARSGAAAVSSSNAALTGWDPNPDGIIDGFAIAGESVVAAGEYRGVGGVARSHLVAFGTKGEVTNWNPGADADIYVLAASGAKVYAGGAFTKLGGADRNHIGLIDENGMIDATFNPNSDNNVYTLLLSGAQLFAGGGFGNIGTQARFAIAALDAASGVATAWNPGANSNVRALAIQDTTLYAGGDFTQFGEGAPVRNHLAAVPTTSNVATAWDPNLGGPAAPAPSAVTVNALVATPTAVYAGGNFTTVGTAARSNLAGIDATSGVATTFAPEPSGIVYALLVDNHQLYIAGEFLMISGATSNHYASYDANGAYRAEYVQNFDFSVRALAAGADTISVAGDFNALNEVYASGFATVPK